MASLTTHSDTLSHHQRRIVLTVWLTYALYYLGRLNFSVAVPGIADTLDLSRAKVGLLATVFLWTYAAGQLVNGQLGNLISPRRLVALGLAMSAVANALFGFQDQLLWMAVLWGMNGLAQSLGWGPILRIVAENLNSKQRARISTLFPMNIPIGTAVTWAVVGILVSIGSWRWAFWTPGFVLIGVLIWWWMSKIDAPTAHQENKPQEGFPLGAIRDEIRDLAPAFIISGLVGFVQLAALTWLPTYVKDIDLFPAALVGSAAGILPLVAVFGMMLSAALLQRLNRVLLTMSIMLSITTVFFLLSVIPIAELQLFFIMLAMLILGGSLSMVLATVPITLANEGRASSAAGISTAVFSLAGGLGSLITGAITENHSWGWVFGMWAVFTILAALIAWLARHREMQESSTKKSASG